MLMVAFTRLIRHADLVTDHVGSVHNKDKCAAEANGKRCGQT